LGDHHPRAERAGPVAADSLAAESTRQGGGFSENRGAEPLGVKGSSSTFANTDTSGATVLAPARDAKERDDNTTQNEVPNNLKGPGGLKFPEAVGGQGDFPGVHDSENYFGGSTEAKKEQTSRSDEPVYQTNDSGSKSSGKQVSEGTEQASHGSHLKDETRKAGTDQTSRSDDRDKTGKPGTEQASHGDHPKDETRKAGTDQTSGSDDRDETGKPGTEQASGSDDIAHNREEKGTDQPTGSDDPVDKTRETGSAPSRDPAPGYTVHVASSSALGGKPKGKNLTEGGFDDDPSHNASFNPDIKSEEDPGREAIKHFQGVTQSVSGDVGPTEKKISGDGQFDVLNTDEKL
jgi:hypothetical protein